MRTGFGHDQQRRRMTAQLLPAVDAPRRRGDRMRAIGRHRAPPNKWGTRSRAGFYIALLGAAGLVVAAFLPWAEVKTFFRPVTISGVDGDRAGWVVAALGVDLVALAIWARVSSTVGLHITAAVLCLVAMAVVALEWMDLTRLINESNTGDGVPSIVQQGRGIVPTTINREVGLYVAGAAAVISALGWYLMTPGADPWRSATGVEN